PDGDRDRLCHDGAVPRGAARLPRPHRHRPCGRTRALMIEGLLQHLPIVPILLPLFAGAALVVVENKTAKTAISVAATTVLLAVSILLLFRADGEAAHAITYVLGDWPAPFGIVLVADRLS